MQGSDRLALDGGNPVRETTLPYGHQEVTEEDIDAVLEVLQSFYLTTGPKVDAFEAAIADHVGAEHAVAFSSGTAALHASTHAAGLGEGDEAITSPLTFCATANCIMYKGATPVLADVREDTLNLDPDRVNEQITPDTSAVLPVDYAGHPAELDAINEIAVDHGLTVIEDASHALGARLDGRPVGSLADLTVFSFHPVKHITTGEGGMVTTDDPEMAERLRRFRNHGINRSHKERSKEGDWHYQVTEEGFNYRLSDLGCALGISQLGRLDTSLKRRRAIADRYQDAFGGLDGVRVPAKRARVDHAWHIYPIRIDPDELHLSRRRAFDALRAEGLGVNVHYIPVHHHTRFQEALGVAPGDFPVTDRAYERLITLPLFQGMDGQDVDDVVSAVRKVARSGA